MCIRDRAEGFRRRRGHQGVRALRGGRGQGLGRRWPEEAVRSCGVHEQTRDRCGERLRVGRWIGIGHAGTAFSIFLLILRQKWRTAINRAAEAMTVVAVFCASLFPLMHMGRPWLFFYIFPYPNTRGPLWVNFNSPLFWDFVAISAYLLISASFWYSGMLPDFATIRDTAKSKIKKTVYGIFAFGWTGSSREWLRFEGLSFVLGGIAAVLGEGGRLDAPGAGPALPVQQERRRPAVERPVDMDEAAFTAAGVVATVGHDRVPWTCDKSLVRQSIIGKKM